jgi:hypothetical protein
MRRPALTIAGVALAALALAGCDSSNGEPGPGPSGGAVPDACQILTSAEVKTLGQEPGTGTTGGGGSRRICTYQNGAVVGVAEGGQYAQYVDTTRQNKDAKCQDVDGLGDKAVFCVVYDTVGQLVFLDGALMYDVSGPAKDLATYRSVAGKIRRS